MKKNTPRSPAARRAFALVRAAFRRGGNTSDNLHEMDTQDLEVRYGLTESDAELLRLEIRKVYGYSSDAHSLTDREAARLGTIGELERQDTITTTKHYIIDTGTTTTRFVGTFRQLLEHLTTDAPVLQVEDVDDSTRRSPAWLSDEELVEVFKATNRDATVWCVEDGAEVVR